MASTGISSAYTNSYAALQKPTPPTQASQLNKQLLGLGATAAILKMCFSMKPLKKS
jgi:hypothetical protein